MCVHRGAVVTHHRQREERINNPPEFGGTAMLYYPVLRYHERPPTMEQWALLAAEPSKTEALARTRREDFRALLEAQRLREAHANVRGLDDNEPIRPGEDPEEVAMRPTPEVDAQHARIDAEYEESGYVPAGEGLVSAEVFSSSDLYEMILDCSDNPARLKPLTDNLDSLIASSHGYSARGTVGMGVVEALASEMGCSLPDLGRDINRELVMLGVRGEGDMACRCILGLSMTDPVPAERLTTLPYLVRACCLCEDGDRMLAARVNGDE